MNRKDAGFTLIEAIIILGIVGLIATLGLPSFVDIIRRHRVITTMHLLSADMAMARGSAIMQRRQVVVCPSIDNLRCANTADWSRGWLVFTDADGNRQPDAAGDILRATQAPSGDGTLSLTSSRPFLRYQVDGRSAHSNLTVHLCAGGALAGQVVVNNHGRARTQRPNRQTACPGR